MNYKTIGQLYREDHYPEAMLRRMQKEGRLPGFYSGNRYYVDVAKFEEKLQRECIANAQGNTEIAQA